MLITLRKYLDRGPATPSAPERHEAPLTEALVQAMRLLIESVGAHAVEAPGVDALPFRRDLSRLAGRLHAGMDELDVLSVNSDVIDRAENWNRQVRKNWGERTGELQNIVNLLTETVTETAAGNARSLAALQTITKDIERATVLENTLDLRLALGRCLERVRQETERRREEVQAGERDFSRQLHDLEALGAAASAASKPPARSGDESATETRLGTYVVAIACCGLDSVAAKYGDNIRHSILARVSEHVRHSLTEGDRMLRWRASSFVAFLERPGQALETVQDTVARDMRAIPEEAYFDLGGRSVLLPTSVIWTIVPIAGYASLKDLFRAIDAFVDQGRLVPALHRA